MSLIKDIIVYAILGAIQGFSEPIPISSSGHLVLFQSIFEKLGLMVMISKSFQHFHVLK